MANYLILNSLVQGVVQAVTVAPSPPSLAGATAGALTAAYHFAGETVADTDLGDGTAITRLLGLGAIAAA